MDILANIILGVGVLVVIGLFLLGYRLFKFKRNINDRIKKFNNQN